MDPAALSGAEAEIEPLTQDPTLLQNTLSQIPIPNLPETIHLQLPPFEQALTYGYKDGLQASPDLARTIQVRERKYFSLLDNAPKYLVVECVIQNRISRKLEKNRLDYFVK